MTDIILPPVSTLPTASDATITTMLDLLFEPSPEIHRLAIPVVRGEQHPPAQAPGNPGLTAEMGNTTTPFNSETPSRAPPFQNTTVPSTAGSSSSYPELIRAIGAQMLALVDLSATAAASSSSPDLSSPRARLHSILGSHPRLGAKKVDSALSRAEQAQLQSQPAAASSSNPTGETEAEALARLNAEYEATFPGLRYVVFVNGRGRDVIMENMRERIDRCDMRAEEREGVQAMIDIALDRASKILAAA
ncbi:Oxo-4-hydroxy-4-carboxy-5-ureidoimidazoline decarboxylase [Microdochium bolleyi]|uniref:Oxo-4-hydroxy-4-carboxy-5-ureidoimidazoline decarboxylase n=1 Tax=Microdochium bolleyi TaxID=196109 RepID=A0A136IUV1_9PEZI|nr:Oxo-4-hydroxy-4-carboxy-5-ureidoimidazoline decarboxylase [Microdochium bolleyi]